MNFNFDNVYNNSYSINDIMNDNNFIKYNSFPNYINNNNNNNQNINFYDNNNCFYLTDPYNFLNYNNYLNYNSYDLNNNSNNFYSYNNNNNNLIENQIENINNYNNNFIPLSNEFSSFYNINNFPKIISQEFFESETYDNSNNNNNNNNSPFINIQINNEFITKKSEILLPKLETFFSLISSKLLSNEEISIKIIDLENSSKFNFKEGFYLLPEDSSEFRYITYTLYNNSTKIARLLKLSSIIYRKIKTLSSSTKRELYYNNVEIFKSVDVTDSIISDLCSILVINKFELPIFPSAKGLFCGNILIKNEFGQELNIKSYNIFNKINLITYEYLIFDLKIEYEIKFILIVEKETLFFNLLENNYFKNIFPNCLIITGKGYPDFITKVFIKKIFNKLNNVPKFYFGDNDPHGLNIYLNYLFGSKNSSRENEFMNISDLKWIGLNNEMVNNIKYLDVHEKNFNEKEDNLNDINNNILNGMIKLDEKDIEKLNKIKNLDIFNLNNWIECKNIHKNNLIENVSVILYEIEQMLNFGYKTEGEFLISKYCNMFIENLNVHITNFYNNLNNNNNNNINLINNITNI